MTRDEYQSSAGLFGTVGTYNDRRAPTWHRGRLRCASGRLEHNKSVRATMRLAALLAGMQVPSVCTAARPKQGVVYNQGDMAPAPHHIPYRNEVLAAARLHAIPVAPLFAIILAESAFDPRAVSHKGAIGLMQLMPSTAQWMAPGVSRNQIFDPALNVEIGARYLRHLANRYKGDARSIVIAWNAGPGRLDRGHIPRETRVFVERVHKFYRH